MLQIGLIISLTLLVSGAPSTLSLFQSVNESTASTSEPSGTLNQPSLLNQSGISDGLISNQSSSPLNEIVICTPWRPLWIKNRPQYDACVTAISLLPTSSTEGNFHTGGYMDGFGLPIITIEQDCKVTVTITSASRSTNSDWSSWPEIRRAADNLLEVCKHKKTPFSTLRTGGRTNAGLEGIITVKLSKRPFGNFNESATMHVKDTD